MIGGLDRHRPLSNSIVSRDAYCRQKRSGLLEDLLSAGLAFALVLQALVNMGVAVGLGPITGLTLPLLSMGGTSLLFNGIALGIILSVSKEEPDQPLKRKVKMKRNLSSAA